MQSIALEIPRLCGLKNGVTLRYIGVNKFIIFAVFVLFIIDTAPGALEFAEASFPHKLTHTNLSRTTISTTAIIAPRSKLLCIIES
jgi:hypothetical protein